MARGRRRVTNIGSSDLAKRLVLNQWIFGLFGLHSSDGTYNWNGRMIPLLDAFKQKFAIGEDTAEGLDGDNVHWFYWAIVSHGDALPNLSEETLLAYDENIVRHTQSLNLNRLARGQEPVTWKYFQYLMLLFTEIYLDRYFRNPGSLILELNRQIARQNEKKSTDLQLDPFDPNDDPVGQLNKLAYWSATGSGKTLLMHANLLQYRFYLNKSGAAGNLNRIILLTPNEGLSIQHLREFELSGIHAELFRKDRLDLFTGSAVEVLDINKLREETGDKTVAVEAFEDNNLVLVDEGHRGASGGESGVWMSFRNQLCQRGFSFEYSATFGQAMAGDDKLAAQYARCMLFDYSYRYFYADGYGKDFHIFNIDQRVEAHLMSYLVACMLSFYQQQCLYRDRSSDFTSFKIERPLWVFVGSSVTARLSSRDATDVVEILRFLSDFLLHRSQSVRLIKMIMTDGIIDATGANVMAGRLTYLNEVGRTPSELFDDILRTIFNSPGGGSLHVEDLKAADGEIAIRVGDNPPFAVINVGDTARLCKLCEDYSGFAVSQSTFGGSLFQEIDKNNSHLNLLVGSKKFVEGWNSWRVSTMTLMNVGAKEGSQIIQLFGRGVRLKGFNHTLKRSSRLRSDEQIYPPPRIETLETLNVFGIRASYMANFREFLHREQVSDNRIETLLPVVRTLIDPRVMTIGLAPSVKQPERGTDPFKEKGPCVLLQGPDFSSYFQRNKVSLNWYPKIETINSGNVFASREKQDPLYFTSEHISFLDIYSIVEELQRFKIERGWYNLVIPPAVVCELLGDRTWYRLLLPREEFEFTNFANVHIWQEIATTLLKKYCERYYLVCKREWELPYLEYQPLDADDPSFPTGYSGYTNGCYRILADRSQAELVRNLEELKQQISRGELRSWQFGPVRALAFPRHLYQPLIHLNGTGIQIIPTPLNIGEYRFVDDLKTYFETRPPLMSGKELYLLRNMSRSRGLGFFEAGNFHPDFIVWVLSSSHQYISFVDPKGIRQLSFDDAKIAFYETVKNIQDRLGHPDVSLNSFIVSNTPSEVMERHWGIKKRAMLSRNILFQEEDKHSYISMLFTKTFEGST